MKGKVSKTEKVVRDRSGGKAGSPKVEGKGKKMPAISMRKASKKKC